MFVQSSSMKKVSLSLLLVVILNQLFAQDTIPLRSDSIHHNFTINVVPDNYNRHLIGIFNFAKGNQKGLHFSLFNWNQDNFKGEQIAPLNIVGGSVGGYQIGLTNICADSLNGLQLGLINCTKKRNGIQIGLINYADTVNSGIVIGFLSIVRKGYQAIEVGISEMYPINLSYKIGLRRQYSSINISLNDKNIEAPVFGFGFGSIKPIGKSFFINPDFSFQRGYFKSRQDILSVSVKMGYALTNKFHISAGPSIVWSHANTAELAKPLYSIYEHSLNDRNAIIIGLRGTLKYNFKG